MTRDARKLLRLLPFVASLFVLLFGARAAHATNIVGGNIINQTWTPAGNPYVIQGDIIVGKFVDRERPTWLDAMNNHFTKVLGDKFQPYGVSNGKD